MLIPKNKEMYRKAAMNIFETVFARWMEDHDASIPHAQATTRFELSAAMCACEHAKCKFKCSHENVQAAELQMSPTYVGYKQC
jgi:hypothetical protein